MARLRYNGQRGQLASTPALTSGATTINFAAVPGFATITGGDYIPITLEPDTANMEIVYLTAYTSGATTGTITRAGEDATLHPAAAHAGSVTWDHGPTAADFAAFLTNPMTTAGDLILGGSAGAPTRLAKGTDLYIMTMDATTHLPLWLPASSGFADPLTTKGDVIVHGTSTTRLPVGSDTQVLTADSAQTLGVKWAAAGGGGSAQEHNEIAAAVLVNATSTGDAGSRADHFTGSSLGGAWTQLIAPTNAATVKNSVLSVRTTTEGMWAQPFTPTGAFRIEARIQQVTIGGVSAGAGIGVDTNTSGTIGTNAEFYATTSGPSFTAYVNSVGGTLGVGFQTGEWVYMALARNASNVYTAWASLDRVTWILIYTSAAWTGVIKRMFFDSNPHAVDSVGAIDFIDVVL